MKSNFAIGFAILIVGIALVGYCFQMRVYKAFDRSVHQLKVGMSEAEALKTMNGFQAREIPSSATEFAGFLLPRDPATKRIGFVRGNRIAVLFIDARGFVTKLHLADT